MRGSIYLCRGLQALHAWSFRVSENTMACCKHRVPLTIWSNWETNGLSERIHLRAESLIGDF